jgi:hypothetical protein
MARAGVKPISLIHHDDSYELLMFIVFLLIVILGRA